MYTNTGIHTIKKVEKLGEFITLNDRSSWKVSIVDKSKSIMWMITDEVTVIPHVGSEFKITHTKRHETIEATYLGK
jgi:hypothetical protein